MDYSKMTKTALTARILQLENGITDAQKILIAGFLGANVSVKHQHIAQANNLLFDLNPPTE